MANSYTQIYIQVVFAVRGRECLINKSWNTNLYKYITAIIQNKGHKVLQINGMPDHIHIFIGLRPNQSLSELVQIVKAESTKWINDEKLSRHKFYWQAGYGAFSYSKKEVPKVINYIQNQEEHHLKVTFREEYIQLLSDFEIEHDEKYIFKDVGK